MAKVAPSSIKYFIIAEFEVDGNVAKPDVIGAIFGQTEGLLGEDLELRNLQESGKIGRIEVEITYQGEKSIGEVRIPSSLDRIETSLVAAAIETIEKIGPYAAKFKVRRVEDVRVGKRSYIIDRAREILSHLTQETPASKELIKKLEELSKEGELIEYSEERLPAGPEIEESKEIIVVEGRADVINLLKNGFKNVIGLDGINIPNTIVELSKRKEVTLFVDGDRGGRMIVDNFLRRAKASYIAFAPPGKEVEELTKKEIFKCLKSRIKVEEYLKRRKGKFLKLRNLFNEIANSEGALLLDEKLNIVARVPLDKLESVLPSLRPHTILVDSVVDEGLYNLCRKYGVKIIGGRESRVRGDRRLRVIKFGKDEA
ncbi:MAG: DNA primase DnaG [Candidatus Nanoarchaeia archaeon]|nr:DNA primase DnaG [Candidatus Haiyanarchaeum thermophilum]MCW1303316.1 DNA primase DnaG [Candidatus Haiyanarchaeum thermophilum]MCW1304102.1 DNA primase DnaG [Candidatus Haiyanarchaeum thermophilum]MCW1306475.1 DNA primase DnaG [Candidatus Haiyanarchaeum thermophilum]MCW1307228.1 DNA primase DnaG [Candidatus Haiyanarchaeum thermophilum]